jgi:hypothetical protein
MSGTQRREVLTSKQNQENETYPLLTLVLEAFGQPVRGSPADNAKETYDALPFGTRLLSSYIATNTFSHEFELRIGKIFSWCLPEKASGSVDAFKEELRSLLEHYKEQQKDSTAHLHLVGPKCSTCAKVITGDRYKCVYCLDVEICQDCEEVNQKEKLHDIEHMYIKIYQGRTFSWKAVWQHRTKSLPPLASTSAVTRMITPAILTSGVPISNDLDSSQAPGLLPNPRV